VTGQWEITDHVCRACLGRVLVGKNDAGVTVARCADCGLEHAGNHLTICWCAVTLNAKGTRPRDAKLRCQRQERPTPSFPAEIVVAEIA
jgi:hypothetical protein